MSTLTKTVPVLELRGVTAGYGATTILRDITVAVKPGTVVALLGPNGAGKTTLLKTAAGLLPVTAGSVYLAGDDATGRSAYQRARGGLCLVPEGRGIFPTLTVHDNLRMQARAGVPMEAAFDAFPILKERRRQVAGTMSGGQQQMLALARCYLARPSVVLLDEVSMGLAPRIVEEIFVALRRLAADGVALLLVEQYVRQAIGMADEVHLLSRGRVTFSGAAADIDEDAITREYLGADVPVA
jgi:branched-chain amino acid transport system ATP-binding protein